MLKRLLYSQTQISVLAKGNTALFQTAISESKTLSKDYNENKHKYKATAQTIETEHAKKAHQISSQRLYKKEGEGTCLTYF